MRSLKKFVFLIGIIFFYSFLRAGDFNARQDLEVAAGVVSDARNYLDELPVPISTLVALHSMENELIERNERKEQFWLHEGKLYEAWKKENPGWFGPRNPVWSHPHNRWLEYCVVNDFFLVGWKKPEDVKIFIEQIPNLKFMKESRQQLVIDYGQEHDNTEFIKPKMLTKVGVSEIKMCTISRDKNLLFTLECMPRIVSSTECRYHYILKERRRNLETGEWYLERKLGNWCYGSPVDQPYVDMMYFEEFETLGLLKKRNDESSSIDFVSLHDIQHDANNAYFARYLHKKSVCKPRHRWKPYDHPESNK